MNSLECYNVNGFKWLEKNERCFKIKQKKIKNIINPWVINYINKDLAYEITLHLLNMLCLKLFPTEKVLEDWLASNEDAIASIETFKFDWLTSEEEKHQKQDQKNCWHILKYDVSLDMDNFLNMQELEKIIQLSLNVNSSKILQEMQGRRMLKQKLLASKYKNCQVVIAISLEKFLKYSSALNHFVELFDVSKQIVLNKEGKKLTETFDDGREDSLAYEHMLRKKLADEVSSNKNNMLQQVIPLIFSKKLSFSYFVDFQNESVMGDSSIFKAPSLNIESLLRDFNNGRFVDGSFEGRKTLSYKDDSVFQDNYFFSWPLEVNFFELKRGSEYEISQLNNITLTNVSFQKDQVNAARFFKGSSLTIPVKVTNDLSFFEDQRNDVCISFDLLINNTEQQVINLVSIDNGRICLRLQKSPTSSSGKSYFSPEIEIRRLELGRHDEHEDKSIVLNEYTRKKAFAFGRNFNTGYSYPWLKCLLLIKQQTNEILFSIRDEEDNEMAIDPQCQIAYVCWKVPLNEKPIDNNGPKSIFEHRTSLDTTINPFSQIVFGKKDEHSIDGFDGWLRDIRIQCNSTSNLTTICGSGYDGEDHSIKRLINSIISNDSYVFRSSFNTFVQLIKSRFVKILNNVQDIEPMAPNRFKWHWLVSEFLDISSPEKYPKEQLNSLRKLFGVTNSNISYLFYSCKNDLVSLFYEKNMSGENNSLKLTELDSYKLFKLFYSNFVKKELGLQTYSNEYFLADHVSMHGPELILAPCRSRTRSIANDNLVNNFYNQKIFYDREKNEMIFVYHDKSKALSLLDGKPLVFKFITSFKQMKSSLSAQSYNGYAKISFIKESNSIGDDNSRVVISFFRSCNFPKSAIEYTDREVTERITISLNYGFQSYYNNKFKSLDSSDNVVGRERELFYLQIAYELFGYLHKWINVESDSVVDTLSKCFEFTENSLEGLEGGINEEVDLLKKTPLIGSIYPLVDVDDDEKFILNDKSIVNNNVLFFEGLSFDYILHLRKKNVQIYYYPSEVSDLSVVSSPQDQAIWNQENEEFKFKRNFSLIMKVRVFSSDKDEDLVSKPNLSWTIKKKLFYLTSPVGVVNLIGLTCNKYVYISFYDEQNNMIKDFKYNIYLY